MALNLNAGGLVRLGGAGREESETGIILRLPPNRRRTARRASLKQALTKEPQLIRHIVMWKLKETAEGATRAENARKLKEKLDACREIVPGILHLEVGIAETGLDSTYDAVLVSDFADKAALDAYQVHPTHQAVRQFIGAVHEARACVDYTV